MSCPFAVPPVAVLPLLRTQVPQVLEDEDGSPLLAGELDNTRTHQMGYVLIHVADLARSQSALSCSFSARMPVCDRWRAIRPNCLAPCAGYRSAFPDKTGGEDRTCNGLDGTHGYVLVKIEIDRTDTCFCVGKVFCDFRWTRERLFHGGVQPPLRPPTNQDRTLHLKAFRKITPEGTDLHPGPTGASPHFEQDG